jgi:hypothetical protein
MRVFVITYVIVIRQFAIAQGMPGHLRNPWHRSGEHRGTT